MIKINLLGEIEVAENNHKLQLGIAIGSLIILIFVSVMIQRSLNGDVEELVSRKTDLEAEVERLKKITKEVKDLEDKRTELENKLAIIAKLKKSKTGPVRVVDDLNNSIPEKAWLKEIKEIDQNLKIDGFALDNQTIAGFMESLEDSDYYSNVDLVETKQAMKSGVKVKEFALKTKINYAGKIVQEPPELQGQNQLDDKKKEENKG